MNSRSCPVADEALEYVSSSAGCRQTAASAQPSDRASKCHRCRGRRHTRRERAEWRCFVLRLRLFSCLTYTIRFSTAQAPSPTPAYRRASFTTIARNPDSLGENRIQACRNEMSCLVGRNDHADLRRCAERRRLSAELRLRNGIGCLHASQVLTHSYLRTVEHFFLVSATIWLTASLHHHE